MMGSLFKWELKQTFSSKAFWITGAALVAIPALMLAITLKGEGFTGYEAYLEGLNNYTSFMMFIIGVFAGIHITGAFEGRKIQAAVMAGNSRIKILLAKFLSYSAATALFSIVSIAVSTAVAFAMKGTGGIEGTFARSIIGRAAILAVVEVAYASVCFLSSMYIRHLGGAIGLNLLLMMALNIAAQTLIEHSWAEKYLRLVPAGQAIFVIADISNKNVLMALSSTVIAFVAVLALSYVKFGKEELK